MYPLKMKPFFKDYLWGGTRLKDEYNKDTALSIVAESWEVSCHPDGYSEVCNGALSGQTLDSVLRCNPGWVGDSCVGLTEFPILIKLIDARDSLSLQVHPDDEYARAVEGQAGKNEMWYIAEARPGAELILGFKEPLNKEDMRRVMAKNELLSYVRSVPVNAGDCYLVPAGLLHAIGKGIIIVEVQQTSNVTYRVHDYDRRDQYGNSRELHTEKAVDVIDTSLRAEVSSGRVLADWRYFKCDMLSVDGESQGFCGNGSFLCSVIVDGAVSLAWGGGTLELIKGDSVFVPAGLGPYKLNGSAKVMMVNCDS